MQNTSSNYIAKDLIRVQFWISSWIPSNSCVWNFPLSMYSKNVLRTIYQAISMQQVWWEESAICWMLWGLRRWAGHQVHRPVVWGRILWPPGPHTLMTMTTCFDHQDNFLTTGSSYSDNQDHILWPPGPHDHENCKKKRSYRCKQNKSTAKNSTKIQLEI